MPGQLDPSRLPVGKPGSATFDVGPATLGPQNGEAGAARNRCAYSHMNYDDPIVYPNQPGASHLHTFFGSSVTNASTTSTAAVRAPGARGTCRGGTADLAAYWVPSLMDSRTGTPLAPTDETDIYYKTGYGGVQPSQIRHIPKGLKMIVGNAKSTTPFSQEFGYWQCGETYNAHTSIPADCGGGNLLVLHIAFPQCLAVDAAGQPVLDSADHKSHLAQASSGCPSSHPYPIPQVSYVVKWQIPAGTPASALRLSSDMYSTAQPGGYSAHADFLEGWDDTIRDTFVDRCVRAAIDCRTGLLGDGRELR